MPVHRNKRRQPPKPEGDDIPPQFTDPLKESRRKRYIEPYIGANSLEYARSGLENEPFAEPKNIGLKYTFYALNVFFLIFILIIISLILYSMFTLKYTPVKQKRNKMIQEANKKNKENGKIDDVAYHKLKKEMEALKKDVDKKLKTNIKRGNKNVDDRNVPRPTIKMDEDKLAEVFHNLAKMPASNNNEIMIPKGAKSNKAMMIAEDEVVCVLRKDYSKKNNHLPTKAGTTSSEKQPY
uniref:Uncharacterized protein n=1 Tax=Parastrongyloides trichosuri TaxID=131310 RepID=A0A0N4ZR68_PARTI